MSSVDTALAANAMKCMELLHRLLTVCLLLALVAAFLPSSATTELKLPYIDVVIPVNSARWVCGVVIFFLGFCGCAILEQLRAISGALADSDQLQIVLTYPSIATLGTPGQRMLVGYALAFIQYSVGFEMFSPMPNFMGGSPDIGLAFLYAFPMFLFAWKLKDWQQGFPKSSKTLLFEHGGKYRQ